MNERRSQGLVRRVTYLMLVRLVLISLVLGVALWLSWLSDANPSAPNSLALMGIIVGTYVLTIVYAVALRHDSDPRRLATVQVSLDMLTTALLVHITGGAQSAYTFFFPLSIIAAAATHFRRGAVLAALAAVSLFTAISILGWLSILPSLTGQRLLPSSLSQVELGRAMALNISAFVGVAVLAYNLGGQIQQTSASLQTQRTKTADLQILHRDIVQSLSSGLLTLDADDGQVLTANRVAHELLDHAEDKPLIGQTIDEVFPELGALVARLTERQGLHRVVVDRVRAGQGKRTLGITVSPLRDNLDVVIGRVINFQDLTDITKMEQKMRKAERLAMVGTLAAGVAHEIRNPLAAISGSIQLLAADPATDEDNRALMAIVTREADRLNTLITELLDYSNPQPREIVRFDMVSLVSETMAVFTQDRAYEHVDVGLSADTHQGAIEISSDPGRVRQVLWNLLGNAAQAARSRVRVRVEWSEHGDNGRAEVAVHVVDDGPGIADEHLERVFDPFFTTKAKGTGLGLATCHNIVVELRGAIVAENLPPSADSQAEKPGGCRFTVRLPLGRVDSSGYNRDDD